MLYSSTTEYVGGENHKEKTLPYDYILDGYIFISIERQISDDSKHQYSQLLICVLSVYLI